MYNDIIGKLKTILQGITEIKAVYDHEPQITTNYPYAVIVPVSRSSSIKTMGAGYNERTYTFTIRVYQSLSGDNPNGQSVLRAIADKIDIALEDHDNITLSGTINHSEMSDASFRFASGENSVYVYEVGYKAKVFYNRNS